MPLDAAKLAKLQAKAGNQIGGKGTARRKKKVVSKTNYNEETKLQAHLKKLAANQIPGIDEVNMFKDDGDVINFKNPKVQISPASNTFAISGQNETKKIHQMLPEIWSQVGLEGISKMKNWAKNQEKEAEKEIEASDLPALDGDFDDVSKNES